MEVLLELTAISCETSNVVRSKYTVLAALESLKCAFPPPCHYSVLPFHNLLSILDCMDCM